MRAINPINNNGSIRLRFSVKGKRFNFSPIPGGKFDNADDFKAAQAIAAQIEGDIRTGNFDATLQKYGPTKSIQEGIDKANQALKELRQKQTAPDLKDLWARYENFKKPQVAHSTFKINYQKRIGNALKELPTTSLNDAGAIRDYLVTTKPPGQAKRILTLINACCEWALEGGIIEVNPFVNFSRRIHTRSEETDINPFTETERDRLIEAFYALDPFYGPLVEFLFFTGCRPSEAIALKWSDLEDGLLTFQRSFVEGEVSPRLKTQKKRVIALSQRVLSLLSGLDNSASLIFPNRQGENLNWHGFASNNWVTVLKTLPEIQYRKPYQCRHTFITLRLRAGDTVADIARYCGNSPVTIYKRYAGSDRAYVPD